MISMLRTLAVLLLLLGLATATPVICLCAPTESAALLASSPRPDTGLAASSITPAGVDRGANPTGAGVTDAGIVTELADSGAPTTSGVPGSFAAPSLVASSALAAVASLIATAGGLPLAIPWRLPGHLTRRLGPPTTETFADLSWSPVVPPPRSVLAPAPNA